MRLGNDLNIIVGETLIKPTVSGVDDRTKSIQFPLLWVGTVTNWVRSQSKTKSQKRLDMIVEPESRDQFMSGRLMIKILHSLANLMRNDRVLVKISRSTLGGR